MRENEARNSSSPAAAATSSVDDRWRREDVATVAMSPANRPPGWPEIAVALLCYLFFLILIALWLFQMPDDQAALRGIVGQ